MSFTGFNLPTITNADLSDEQERRKILEYLFQLTEQLRFVLNNLDEDNFSPQFLDEIQDSDAVNALSTRVEDAENGVYSLRKQTAEEFTQMVRKDGVLSAINQTAELIKIAAGKIALEGYVSINGTFSVDATGYMRATGGTIGNWNILPNMILGGPLSEINSGKIVGSQIYGIEIHGSNGIYMDADDGPTAPYITKDGIYSHTYGAGGDSNSLKITNGWRTIWFENGTGGSINMQNSNLNVSGNITAANITTMQSQITNLQNRVTALESK